MHFLLTSAVNLSTVLTHEEICQSQINFQFFCLVNRWLYLVFSSVILRMKEVSFVIDCRLEIIFLPNHYLQKKFLHKKNKFTLMFRKSMIVSIGRGMCILGSTFRL